MLGIIDFISDFKLNNFFFTPIKFSLHFFFDQQKDKYIKRGEVSSGTQEVDKRNQLTKTQKPKNYLLPNQVRKSTTEFVLTT